MSSLLIIDDDVELGEMLKEYLEPEDFAVTLVHRGDQGAEIACAQNWDLIILDIMLPGMNGIEVLRTIRSQSMTPVLMLTAKGDDIDRILGLELGADDYLPKPFNPRELVARLRAILRRNVPAGSEAQGSAQLQCRTLVMNPGARRASIKQQPLELTSTEFSILEILVKNAGLVVPKNTLYESALGRPMAAYDRSIDMHISHLRKKLSQLDTCLIIHTVRGSGYQLEN